MLIYDFMLITELLTKYDITQVPIKDEEREIMDKFCEIIEREVNSRNRQVDYDKLLEIAKKYKADDNLRNALESAYEVGKGEKC